MTRKRSPAANSAENLRTRQTHICHLTSAHPRNDSRIFWKHCRSLQQAGYRVSLLVADGGGQGTEQGVTIHDAGPAKGRAHRFWLAAWRLGCHARKIDADVYHIHDPELLLTGLRLRLSGKQVIYDAHEDLPTQILAKNYLTPWLQPLISRLSSLVLFWTCTHFDRVVAATPHIAQTFRDKKIQCPVVANYPILEEFPGTDKTADPPVVCYVGNIAFNRGGKEMIAAMDSVRHTARLQLAGRIIDPELEATLPDLDGWQHTDHLGMLDRAEVARLLGRSRIGLVLLHPTPNYIPSLPIKLFEYMSAGIPVIASHFPLWKSIIEDADCGLCVDPLDPQMIAQAIDFLLSHPQKAQDMGRNGRNAVLREYNWKTQENKLLALYRDLGK